MLGEGEVFCQVEPFSFANSTKQESSILKRGVRKAFKIEDDAKLKNIAS
jgi:hypothetical protein